MVKAFLLIQYYFFETKFIWSKINKTILKIDDVGSKEKYIHIMQNRTQENALRKCIVKQNIIYLIILIRKYTFFPTMQLIDCSLINYNSMNQLK